MIFLTLLEVVFLIFVGVFVIAVVVVAFVIFLTGFCVGG